MKKTVIIDYQLSNLKSVEYACESVGLMTVTSSDKQEIATADALILPGVGAFADAMMTLDSLGISQVIKAKMHEQTPLFGVCLGLQLLFSQSEEFGTHQGLNIIAGRVKRFPSQNDQHEPIRVPQIAWNQLEKGAIAWENTPFKHLNDGDFAYFVHSYYIIPDEKEVVLSTTTYSGFNYCSSLLTDNIFAVQFHPEKSGAPGIQIYRNWAEQYHLK